MLVTNPTLSSYKPYPIPTELVLSPRSHVCPNIPSQGFLRSNLACRPASASSDPPSRPAQLGGLGTLGSGRRRRRRRRGGGVCGKKAGLSALTGPAELFPSAEQGVVGSLLRSEAETDTTEPQGSRGIGRGGRVVERGNRRSVDSCQENQDTTDKC